MSNDLEVVFVGDRGCVLGLAVALDGLVRHLASGRTVTIHLLHDRLPERVLRRLAKLTASRPHTTLRVGQIPADLLYGLPGVAHVPPISYTRLFLPDLLPESGRLLYLDADLVINLDIGELYDHELAGCPVAACRDPGLGALGGERCLDYCRHELIDVDAPALNAGVLLIDCDRWRAESVTSRAVDFVRRHAGSLRWADQDALNFALVGRWAELPARWNVPITRLVGPTADREPPSSELRSLADAAMDGPAIYHLFGGHKPWNSGPRHTLRKPWLAHLHRSGFAGLGTRLRLELSAYAFPFRSRLRVLRRGGKSTT
ncbi:MAG: glycosyltransferase family 8 protein [Planctomycetota bacterium]